MYFLGIKSIGFSFLLIVYHAGWLAVNSKLWLVVPDVHFVQYLHGADELGAQAFDDGGTDGGTIQDFVEYNSGGLEHIGHGFNFHSCSFLSLSLL